MGDSEVVASIVAGDPRGLAEAYDRYADDLYSYCRSMLREPADAADAVQDTFVIAAAKLGGLRDPERLRAWLFAVARNECLHRLRTRAAESLHDIPDQADSSVDIGGDAERAETRALIRAAVAGLNAGERDVINQLWHGLDVAEVASVLGVSRNHAYSLFARARDQLEASVGVLLVGRTGRRDCPALDSLLHDWDGRLTVLIRKRVHRHIGRCTVCSDRRRRELHPALLLALTPGALLGMAVARHALQAVASATALSGLPPATLRGEVLRLAAGQHPHAPGSQLAAGGNTHTFGMNGFPRPPHAGHLPPLRLPHLHLAAGSTVAVVPQLVPHGRHAAPGPGITTQAPGHGPGQGTLPPSPGTTGTRPVPTGRASVVASVSASGGVTPSKPAGTPPVTGGTPTTAPTGTPATTPTPVVSVTVSGPVVTGSLTVSPTSITLSPLLGGTLTLTANGGPVAWSISEPTSLLGKLLLSQTSGTLNAGQSTTVTLTVSGLISLDTVLTVAPGPTHVTVLLGLA